MALPEFNAIATWLLFAGAAWGAFLSIKLMVIAPKGTLRFFRGHLQIGFGFALFCLGAGPIVMLGSDLNLVSVLAWLFVISGSVLVLFGYRQANKFDRLAKALKEVEAKSLADG